MNTVRLQIYDTNSELNTDPIVFLADPIYLVSRSFSLAPSKPPIHRCSRRHGDTTTDGISFLRIYRIGWGSLCVGKQTSL